MQILNGKVYFNGKITDKDILIENGKIIEIANKLTKEDGEQETIDAKGKIIFPGLIDLHVHLREPGFDYKEDFRTGTSAAVTGGITAVFDMPNNKVPVTTAKLMKEKILLARSKAVCKIGFYLGASAGNEIEWKKINEPELVGLKIYMGQTTGDLLVDSEKTLETHFANFDPKKPIVVHAEDQKTMEKEGRTENAAEVAVQKAAKLGKKYSRKMHVAHASTGNEVQIVKATYSKATVETCPHYLFISESELAKLGYLNGVNPPVRNNSTRQELWKHFEKIDCISTDHAPHTLEDKKNGAKGFPGLETSLALMLDAYNRKLIEIEKIPKMMSENPAKIIGMDRNGKIEPGMNADLTIVDIKKEWIVVGEELETKCRWSPFSGRKLKGKNAMTIINGKLVFDEQIIS